MANTTRGYIDGFRRYDQYVDLVSIFESLYGNASDFRETVEHFERYPKVTAPDGEVATPDFTVLFKDGTGLAGEIASVAQQQESLDSACKQIGRYDELTQLPRNSSGSCAEVSHVDVLFLTHHETASRVAKRLLNCIADGSHPYSPSHPPLIASFVLSANATPSRYVIEKILLQGNGALREVGRSPSIGQKLADGPLISSAKLFGPTKVERVFMNDPIDPLYLATHLWTRLFAELSPTHGSKPNPLYLTESEIAEELRERYGRGSKRDVRRAMEHLKQARLCGLEEDGKTWLIAWHELRGSSTEHDAAVRIASRIVKPPAKGAVSRVRDQIAKESELRLFD